MPSVSASEMQSYQAVEIATTFSSLNSAEKRNLSQNDSLATENSDLDAPKRPCPPILRQSNSSAPPAFLPSGPQNDAFRELGLEHVVPGRPNGVQPRSLTWKPWASGSRSSMKIVLYPVMRAQPS